MGMTALKVELADRYIDYWEAMERDEYATSDRVFDDHIIRLVNRIQHLRERAAARQSSDVKTKVRAMYESDGPIYSLREIAEAAGCAVSLVRTWAQDGGWQRSPERIRQTGRGSRVAQPIRLHRGAA